MAEDKRKRPWIKQRLAESADATYAHKIWERWKATREASKNVARALRLYDALLKGDTKAFHKLMTEFFPGYGMSLEAPHPAVPQPYTPPAANYLPRSNNHNGHLAAAEIVVTREAYNEAEEDDDDLGFGNLEIG